MVVHTYDSNEDNYYLATLHIFTFFFGSKYFLIIIFGSRLNYISKNKDLSRRIKSWSEYLTVNIEDRIAPLAVN